LVLVHFHAKHGSLVVAFDTRFGGGTASGKHFANCCVEKDLKYIFKILKLFSLNKGVSHNSV
jgi:hypothetical protein